MLTSDQQQRINGFSEEKRVTILPCDPNAEEKFQVIKKRIQEAFGDNISVVHRGSTSLGISGKDEIDVYVPVSPKDYDGILKLMQSLFGEARSHYPLQRTRFLTYVDKKPIDLFLINKESEDWIEGTAFEDHLRNNPQTLKEFQDMKEKMNRSTVKDYYQWKTEFVYEILNKIRTEAYLP